MMPIRGSKINAPAAAIMIEIITAPTCPKIWRIVVDHRFVSAAVDDVLSSESIDTIPNTMSRIDAISSSQPGRSYKMRPSRSGSATTGLRCVEPESPAFPSVALADAFAGCRLTSFISGCGVRFLGGGGSGRGGSAGRAAGFGAGLAAALSAGFGAGLGAGFEPGLVDLFLESAGFLGSAIEFCLESTLGNLGYYIVFGTNVLCNCIVIIR
jgi:hypothetical protein